MKKQTYADLNAAAVDNWVSQGWEWGKPVSHETYQRALAGDWSIRLTPTHPIPDRWFPPLSGCRVLCLASGGGQQGPILTARGAVCTVLDYSKKQLESEQMVARREGYEIALVRADMSQGLPFADSSFDLIVNPVSNCYIEDACALWRECYRVLAPGGILMAGLDNGLNYVFDETEEDRVVRGLPFNPLKEKALYEASVKNDWGIQFSHTFNDQIAGQLRAGFQLTDGFEDYNGIGLLNDLRIPTFWATRAVKPEK